MLRTTLAALLLFTVTASAMAQSTDSWPSKPIKLVIGYPPGGSIDILSRGLAPGLGKALGQSVIIDNRPEIGRAHV